MLKTQISTRFVPSVCLVLYSTSSPLLAHNSRYSGRRYLNLIKSAEDVGQRTLLVLPFTSWPSLYLHTSINGTLFRTAATHGSVIRAEVEFTGYKNFCWLVEISTDKVNNGINYKRRYYRAILNMQLSGVHVLMHEINEHVDDTVHKFSTIEGCVTASFDTEHTWSKP